MTIPLGALLAFVLWTMLPLGGMGWIRLGRIRRGEARTRDYLTGGVATGDDLHARLVRVHLNCLENLPLFGSVVLVAHVIGLASGAFDGLSIAYMVLRVGQSTVHAASPRARAITLRFVLYSAQIAVLLVMMALVVFGRG